MSSEAGRDPEKIPTTVTRNECFAMLLAIVFGWILHSIVWSAGSLPSAADSPESIEVDLDCPCYRGPNVVRHAIDGAEDNR